MINIQKLYDDHNLKVLWVEFSPLAKGHIYQLHDDEKETVLIAPAHLEPWFNKHLPFWQLLRDRTGPILSIDYDKATKF